MNEISIDPAARRSRPLLAFARFGFLPAFFYFACFFLLTYPLLLKFSTHFFADDGDGFQHVWNLWWINRAIVDLHQSPWFTTDLHFPHGCSLLGHALDLTDGIIGIALQRFLTLVQTYNSLVVFAFISSGVAAFWLAWIFTRTYFASLIAGFIFTFSSYHFAHAQGHLELVSMQWIPLFAICWHRQLQRGSLLAAVGSAICLALTFYDSYYYFFYCILLALIFTIALGIQDKSLLFSARQVRCMGLFFILVGIAVGPIFVDLLLSNHRDPLQGNHNPVEGSMDLLAPFIYGGHWRFASLTRWYWSRLPGNIHETSVHIGIAVLFLAACAWVKRRRLARSSIGLWAFAFAFFGVMSLGPAFQIFGHAFSWIPLPYRILELFPPLRLSGVPVRMEIMAQLSAAVLAAFGIKFLMQRPGRLGRMVLAAILILMVFEYLPAPLPATSPAPPAYIRAIQSATGPGAVIDGKSSFTHAMYYATLDQRPLAFGYLSRVPLSVLQKDSGIYHFMTERDFDTLKNLYGFRFLIVDPRFGPAPGKVIYRDSSVIVYDLMSRPGP